MRIGVLNLREVLKTEYTESLVKKLLAGVGAERQERIRRYFHQEDKLRSLAAEYLLMTMLKEDGKLADAEYPLTFVPGHHGKPEIKAHPEIHFNLSHSGELVVCALADHYPVGVDVQDWRGIKDGVARRCFTNKERAWLESLDSCEEKEKAFYHLWTLKESFIKVIGIGMSFPMKRVEFAIGEEVTVSQDWNEKIYRAKIYEISAETEGRYELAVCSEEEPAIMFEEYQMDPDSTITRWKK